MTEPFTPEAPATGQTYNQVLGCNELRLCMLRYPLFEYRLICPPDMDGVLISTLPTPEHEVVNGVFMATNPDHEVALAKRAIDCVETLIKMCGQYHETPPEWLVPVDD